MFWPPVRGDSKNQTERWTLNGVTATYSDRGRLFPEITATTLILYKDRGLATADKVAEVSGGHGAPSSWTKLTITALNSSGITGSVYFKYDSADAGIEVYPILATDTDLLNAFPGFDRFPYQINETTWFNQHVKTREDFVAKLLSSAAPMPGRSDRATGTIRGDNTSIWRVNSVGDYEVRRLQNVWSYKRWALWYTAAMVMRINLNILEETDQLRVIEDADEKAAEAWGEVQLLYDADEDYDADEEVPRFRIRRG